MITEQDIECLAQFYKKVNQKNYHKVDLDAFIVENDIPYSFQEDIIDNLIEYMNEFSEITKLMKKINWDKSIEELVFNRNFLKTTGDLYTLFGRLSITFEDFQKFVVKISQSLPEGPDENDELT